MAQLKVSLQVFNHAMRSKSKTKSVVRAIVSHTFGKLQAIARNANRALFVSLVIGQSNLGGVNLLVFTVDLY